MTWDNERPISVRTGPDKVQDCPLRWRQEQTFTEVELEWSGGCRQALGSTLYDAVGELQIQLGAQAKLQVVGLRGDARATVDSRFSGRGDVVWVAREGSPSGGCSAHVLDADRSQELPVSAQDMRLLTDAMARTVATSCPTPQDAVGMPRTVPFDVAIAEHDPRRALFGTPGGWYFFDNQGQPREFSPQVNPVEVTVVHISEDWSRPCSLLVEFHNKRTKLTLVGPGLARTVAEAEDLFTALAQIRQGLESQGRLLAVAACERGSWPIGSAKRLVGRHALGKRMGHDRYCDALSPAQNEPVSLREQCEFRPQWLASMVSPTVQLRAEAEDIGDGYVHVLTPSQRFAGNSFVVVYGSWRVDNGVIVGVFIPNPHGVFQRRPVALGSVSDEDYAQMCESATAGYCVPTGPYPVDGH